MSIYDVKFAWPIKFYFEIVKRCEVSAKKFFCKKWSDWHWETAVTKKSVVFVPLYTLCGKVQNCTEGLQVMHIVTKKIFVKFYHLITNNRFVTMHKL